MTASPTVGRPPTLYAGGLERAVPRAVQCGEGTWRLSDQGRNRYALLEHLLSAVRRVPYRCPVGVRSAWQAGGPGFSATVSRPIGRRLGLSVLQRIVRLRRRRTAPTRNNRVARLSLRARRTGSKEGRGRRARYHPVTGLGLAPPLYPAREPSAPGRVHLCRRRTPA